MGTLSLGRIGQIAVNAHDLPRAVAFYRDALGMQLLFEVPGMAFFAAGALTLGCFLVFFASTRGPEPVRTETAAKH